jgi:hypothetical protein
MISNRLINCFIAGSQKTGSTWLYQCFKEHPEIYVPEIDAIHLFTINYNRSTEIINRFYSNVESEKVICDPTPSYIRDSQAAERIYRYNPDAKLIFTLRNPIERSFSHYWHQKSRKQIFFNFADSIIYKGVGNYDLYEIWIKSSFYFDQLKPYFEVFPREQILVCLFDDLKKNPESFLSNMYEFLGVDSSFKPTVLNSKINAARIPVKDAGIPYGQIDLFRKLRQALKIVIRDTKPTLRDIVLEPEYLNEISDEVRMKLNEIFREQNLKLQELIGRDLSCWNS